MLRPSIARKIIRLRSVRLLARGYQTPLPRQPTTVYDEPLQQFPQYTGLYAPELPAYPIEEIEQIDNTSDQLYQHKLRLTERAELDAPELDDSTLRSFYADLLAAGVDEELQKKDVESLLLEGRRLMDKPTITDTLRGLAERFEASGLIASRTADRLVDAGQEISLGQVAKQNTVVAKELVEALERMQISSTSKPLLSLKGKEKSEVRPDEVPSGVASQREWDALFDHFIWTRNTQAAEKLIGTMIQHGVRPDEGQIMNIMQVHARAGRTEDIARMTNYLNSIGVPITESHHHIFITALLAPDNPHISTAITYLREFEKSGTPLPQSTYNLILRRLTTPTPTYHTNAHTRAQALDLFYHMRLQAHPTPSRYIYTTMIKACSDPRDPQPERARDLWIEMTQEGDRVKPQKEEYDAIIQALGSTKKDYLEAFDLSRQMLAKHHEIALAPFDDEPKRLWSPYVPDLKTFNALMEGTKRAGDLERARWVLSELIGMVRSSEALASAGRMDKEREIPITGPDTSMMTSLFMTYAAWKPKVTRQKLKQLTTEGSEGQEGGVSVVGDEEEGALSLEAKFIEELSSASESVEPDYRRTEDSSRPVFPITAADALREADGLFARLIYDLGAKNDDIWSHPFCRVELTTRLVNSYLSVQFAHHSSVVSRQDIGDIWDQTWKAVREVRPSVKPDGWSYMWALQFGAKARRDFESRENRNARLQWGRQIWSEYKDWHDSKSNPTRLPTTSKVSEDEGRAIVTYTATIAQRNAPFTSPVLQQTRWLSGLGDRQVENCWKNGIRIQTLSGDLDGAMTLLQDFTAQFPPRLIHDTYTPMPISDILHVSDLTSIAEPNVPPHFIFEDLDVLHKALMVKGRIRQMKELNAIIHAYTDQLIRRRKRRTVGDIIRPKKDPKKVSQADIQGYIAQGANMAENALPDDEPEEGDWDRVMGYNTMPGQVATPTSRGPNESRDAHSRKTSRSSPGRGDQRVPWNARHELQAVDDAYVEGDWNRPKSFQAHLEEHKMRQRGPNKRVPKVVVEVEEAAAGNEVSQ